MWLGRVPFGETLIRPQCSDVWGNPRLFASVKESGRRAEFDTYDAINSASHITHHSPGARAPVSVAGLPERLAGRSDRRGRLLRLGLELRFAHMNLVAVHVRLALWASFSHAQPGWRVHMGNPGFSYIDTGFSISNLHWNWSPLERRSNWSLHNHS